MTTSDLKRIQRRRQRLAEQFERATDELRVAIRDYDGPLSRSVLADELGISRARLYQLKAHESMVLDEGKATG